MRGTAFKNDKKQENNFKMNITAKQYDDTLADTLKSCIWPTFKSLHITEQTLKRNLRSAYLES